jgi:putative transcriptional regulator
LKIWFIFNCVLDLLCDISVIYKERGELEAVGALLEKAGFAVSQTCWSRPSCFDFVARKSQKLIFIRIQPDIDGLSSSDSAELKGISGSVSAASLLISKNAREKPLEDDTVYSRYSILAITPRTFENIVSSKIQPLIQAGPGGYYVDIDGAAIRHRRQQLGLSVGKIAEMIGISRRTLYGYERGMAKASVTAAYNIICTLGIPVARPVDVFERPANKHKCFLLTTAKRVIAKHRFLMKIFSKFDYYNILTVRKAPFDFVITIPEDRKRIIGGVADNNEAHLDRRVEEILSVSKVVEAHPILVTDGQEPSNKDIPCVHTEELSKIKSPEDLISNIT